MVQNAFRYLELFMQGSRARSPGIPFREFPGIVMYWIPGNFWNSSGYYGEFIRVLSFLFFVVDCDILVFNLTLCLLRARTTFNRGVQ